MTTVLSTGEGLGVLLFTHHCDPLCTNRTEANALILASLRTSLLRFLTCAQNLKLGSTALHHNDSQRNLIDDSRFQHSSSQLHCGELCSRWYDYQVPPHATRILCHLFPLSLSLETTRFYLHCLSEVHLYQEMCLMYLQVAALITMTDLHIVCSVVLKSPLCLSLCMACFHLRMLLTRHCPIIPPPPY